VNATWSGLHYALFNRRRLRPGWRILLFFSLFILLSGLSQFPVVALILTSWALTHFVDRRPFASLGFATTRRTLGQLGGGILLGAGLFGLVVALIALLGGIRFEAGDVAGGSVTMLFAYLLIHLNIALLEEGLARGYAFQALFEGLGPLPALLITSVGFGLLHFDNPSINGIALFNLVLAGLLLGVLVLKTKALWMAIGFHFSWNLVQSNVLGLPVSGVTQISKDSWFKTTLNGSDWLTGGAFGPEASPLTTLVLSLATLAALRSRWVSPDPESERLWNAHLGLQPEVAEGDAEGSEKTTPQPAQEDQTT